jgi:hypothetical protein
MDVSGQLAGVRGSGDSGHPETIQIRWNDLQALAKSLSYQKRERGAHQGGVLQWRHEWWCRVLAATLS